MIKLSTASKRYIDCAIRVGDSVAIVKDPLERRWIAIDARRLYVKKPAFIVKPKKK